MSPTTTLLGVNLPWLSGAYGHDMAANENHPDWPAVFDGREVVRSLRLSRSLGFEAVRIWLCERAEGVVTRDGRVAGVQPALLEHLALVQQVAKREGFKVYWTLLDANAWKRDGDAITHSVIADAAQTARFAEHVAAPIARALDPAVTLALELLNEPEVMTPECAVSRDEPVVAWGTIGVALRTLGDAVRTAVPGMCVTAGSLHVFAPTLWKSGAALDAMDLHMYHATGGLPSREQMARESGDARIATGEVPLFAGECGLPDEADATEAKLLSNYLPNAIDNGYAAAFLWKLEGDLLGPMPAREPTTAAREVQRVIAASGRRVPR